MVSITPYQPEHKTRWDQFVRDSKNGVFLFHRDYMEYHSDRFADASLLFFDGDRLLAVMPANRQGDVLYSHGGLTFGGILSDQKMRTPVMLEVFSSLSAHLRECRIGRLVYKAVPYIYHEVPAEEDLYALFRHDARLVRRDVSSTVCMGNRVALSKGRKWSIKKGKANGLDVRRSGDFATFMQIEEDVLLRKYGVRPTHTADEMKLLADRFPEHIKLFAAYHAEKMVAGVIVYESRNVAHAQYIAGTDEGKELFAGDLLIDFLLTEVYAGKRYFDFGISTEEQGRVLNVGLVTQKEEYGARATVYDTYEMEIR